MRFGLLLPWASARGDPANRDLPITARPSILAHGVRNVVSGIVVKVLEVAKDAARAKIDSNRS